MAQSNLTVRLDNSDKKQFAEICESIGLSVSAAYTIFTKAVIHKRKIPFELEASDDDGFYSPANIRHLEELKRLDDEGKLKFKTVTMEEIEEMCK